MARDDAAILARIRQALAEPKRLLLPVAWRTGQRPDKLVLAALCQSRTIGVQLHGRAHPHRPDEDVSFQLCLDEPDETWPVARIDWRPVSPHTNRMPDAFRGTTVWDSGLHPFEENAVHGLTAMKAKNLPVCRPLLPEPASYADALAAVSATLNIVNANALPVPPWSPRLFP
ncbi:hypothetical protein [Methylorubrum sp. SB2]|uniref:hypothetical protein n=1 Tax=Methylorubrum subtropicum TaxID=3138812 RepID=UPI00313CFFF1